jgi:hypothetical protein
MTCRISATGCWGVAFAPRAEGNANARGISLGFDFFSFCDSMGGEVQMGSSHCKFLKILS